MSVTGFDVALRRPLADGRPFGAAGPYEELKGRARKWGQTQFRDGER